MTSKETAKELWKMNQLHVSQNDGVVRTHGGQIVGKQKWIVNVDYSLDTKEGEDFIVNAASSEEAEEKVQKLLEGQARRKGMSLGSVFVNFAGTKEQIDG
tara:strand:- start:1420 stop:1719 length:300 start_codon:yes stop_codon:yes gene_type:complete